MPSATASLDPNVKVAAAVRAIYVCALYRLPSSSDPGIRDMTVTFAALGG